MAELSDARAKRASSGESELALLRAALQQQGALLATLHAMAVRMQDQMTAVQAQLAQIDERLP